MKTLRWLPLSFVVLLSLAGCGGRHPPKKPDPTKGRVTGIVICEDTGKPARFATVTLTGIVQKDANPEGINKADDAGPLPAIESADTDLEGRFRMEAVEPGRYYAFATLEGYLDPARGIDFAKLEGLENDHDRSLEAIREWKNQMVEVNVGVHHASEITIRIARAAEIAGNVTFDDGSPAIGMHFQLLRKTAANTWTGVGIALFADWKIASTSDGHGRYTITNLPSGEYKICALMPADDEDSAPRVCLGNTFRSKTAASLKVRAGETANGADIVIPLTGLHSVAGMVTAVSDGHPLVRGKLQLLYADDKEVARKTSLLEDGSFAFQFVPDGSYILQVSGAAYPDPKVEDQQKNIPAQTYQDKEIPLVVAGNLEEVNLPLIANPLDTPAK